LGFKLYFAMKYDSIKLDGIIYNTYNIDSFQIPSEPTASWRNAICVFMKEWFDSTEFITSNTSGSTGTPKVIQLSKLAMVNSARMTNCFFDLTPDKTALLCLPASYIAGKMMLVRAIVGGFDLKTVEPSANPFANITSAIDFVAITPYQLHHSAECLSQKLVKKIIVGGGPVTSQLEEIAESIPSALYETYGMTETCSHIALRRFNGADKSSFFSILDGIAIEEDERECLIISAPTLCETKIQTNDIVKLVDTNSFYWLGRFDSTINSGGVKIHPEQVERKLQAAILSNHFVSSIPDPQLGQKVVLVIESEHFNSQEEELLEKVIKDLLDKYEQPKQIFYLSAFIYSQSNKVLRSETLEKAMLQG